MDAPDEGCSGKSEKSTVEERFFRKSPYRPFLKLHFYFADFWNEERYQQHHIFPTASSNNLCISLNASPGDSRFHCLAADEIPDLHLQVIRSAFLFIHTTKTAQIGKKTLPIGRLRVSEALWAESEKTSLGG